MLDYSSNEFFIIYSLHFVCHYLFGGRLKNKKIKIKKKNLILDLQNLRIVREK